MLRQHSGRSRRTIGAVRRALEQSEIFPNAALHHHGFRDDVHDSGYREWEGMPPINLAKGRPYAHRESVPSFETVPVLAFYKRKLATEINSRALRADAMETLACSYLSLTLVLGLGLNALFGWWWADPVAALAMVYFLIKEGWEAIGEGREGTKQHDGSM